MMRRRRAAGILTLAMLAAGLLTAFDLRFASSTETRLTASSSRGEVPAGEPFDDYWDGISAVELPLSAQKMTPPNGGRASTASARAVHDSSNLYVLLEWTDSTSSRSAGRVQDFTDAAAVEFPADGSESVPALCMGDPTRSVNIWQWRASWQENLAPTIRDQYPNTVVDDYPFSEDPVFTPSRSLGNPVAPGVHESAVDNLVAGGFGSLTSDDVSPVHGIGEWHDGRWRVVFTRPLEVGREGNVDLPVGARTNLAFAVWDGEAEERNGMKSVSGFATLSVSPDRLPSHELSPNVIFIVIVILFVALGMWMIPGRPKGAARA